mmetsp:Transcript_140020/g.261060  ORF Transcript_140020/g.261060 Transcript_140020/m.261060 type:complete len:86 (-) Transcript_140020:951-1208(-)
MLVPGTRQEPAQEPLQPATREKAWQRPDHFQEEQQATLETYQQADLMSVQGARQKPAQEPLQPATRDKAWYRHCQEAEQATLQLE